MHLALLNTTQRPAGCDSVKSNGLIRLMMCQSYIKDDAQGGAVFNVWAFFFQTVLKQQLQSKYLNQEIKMIQFM